IAAIPNQPQGPKQEHDPGSNEQPEKLRLHKINGWPPNPRKHRLLSLTLLCKLLSFPRRDVFLTLVRLLRNDDFEFTRAIAFRRPARLSVNGHVVGRRWTDKGLNFARKHFPLPHRKLVVICGILVLWLLLDDICVSLDHTFKPLKRRLGITFFRSILPFAKGRIRRDE